MFVLIQALSPLIVIMLVCIAVATAYSKSHRRVFLINLVVAVCLQLPILYFLSDGFDGGFFNTHNWFVCGGLVIIALTFLVSHIGYAMFSHAAAKI